MKQESIEARRARQKREAVRSVVIAGVLELIGAAFCVCLALIPGIPVWLSIALFAPAVLCLLLILSAVRALKERFREIEGGELDAAGQY